MEEMIMSVQRQGLLTLVRSGLTGECLSLPEEFDRKAVYQQLKRHQVMAAGYLGAIRCGLSKQDPLVARLFQCYCQILDHSEKQQRLIADICAAFDEAGVDYMLLKGCNLKKIYPAPELRAMGDADILIQTEQYERIRPLLVGLGFVEIRESDHELIWKHNDLVLELHKRLIPSYNKDYCSYFGDGWRLAIVQSGTRWAMRQEDELIYLMTHFAKHYRDSGIGLRHLADLRVFLQANSNLDMDYVRNELKTLRLLEFYDNVMKTIAAWFGEGAWDEIACTIMDRVCGSGAFGTKEDHDVSAVVRSAGANKTVIQAWFARAGRLVFPTYDRMKKKHPILGKIPILLPVFWVGRIFDVLLFQRGQLKETAHQFRSANAQAAGKYQQELDLVGLKFDFEE